MTCTTSNSRALAEPREEPYSPSSFHGIWYLIGKLSACEVAGLAATHVRQRRIRAWELEGPSGAWHQAPCCVISVINLSAPSHGRPFPPSLMLLFLAGCSITSLLCLLQTFPDFQATAVHGQLIPVFLTPASFCSIHRSSPLQSIPQDHASSLCSPAHEPSSTLHAPWLHSKGPPISARTSAALPGLQACSTSLRALKPTCASVPLMASC